MRGWSVVFALLLAGCVSTGPQPSGPNAPDAVHVSNGTTIAVSVVVNGVSIASLPPGALESTPRASLPQLPWNVEVRTSRGRVLTSLTVRDGDVFETTAPDGSHIAKGDATRVDLSCGRLDVWVGPPLLGPSPGPGTPGDCDP